VIYDRDRVFGSIVSGGSTQWASEINLSRPGPARRTVSQNDLIGSIRGECPDHIIVFGEAHVRWAPRELL
jgi:hypothetical protein